MDIQRINANTRHFLVTKENMITSLLFFMISTGYAFAKELTAKYLHSFFSLSWVIPAFHLNCTHSC